MLASYRNGLTAHRAPPRVRRTLLPDPSHTRCSVRFLRGEHDHPVEHSDRAAQHRPDRIGRATVDQRHDSDVHGATRDTTAWPVAWWTHELVRSTAMFLSSPAVPRRSMIAVASGAAAHPARLPRARPPS